MKYKSFNDMAIRRTAVILKNGIGYDRSLREMLAQAYTHGFIDCCEVNVHENAINTNKSSQEGSDTSNVLD